MIGNRPDLDEQVWSGEVELELGDLNGMYAQATIHYTTDGNAFAKGEYKFTATMKGLDGKPVEVDLTDSISENAVDDIMDEYIVSRN